MLTQTKSSGLQGAGEGGAGEPGGRGLTAGVAVCALLTLTVATVSLKKTRVAGIMQCNWRSAEEML